MKILLMSTVFLSGMLFMAFLLDLQEAPDILEQNRLLRTQNEILRTDCERREYRDRNRHILRLAEEFGIESQVVEYVMEEAQGNLLMTRLALAVAVVESRGDFQAIGDGGKARGLFQMWDTTAQMYVDDADLHDVETSVELFFVHWVDLFEHYRGDVSLALAAYNRGRGRVDSLISSDRNPINGYPSKVLRLVDVMKPRSDNG